MTAKDKAVVFYKTARQYKGFSARGGVVEKVFNRGAGALALYRFGAGVRVTVNGAFERASDRRRLLAFMPDAVIVEDTLGYPDWYFRGLADPDKA